MDLNRLYFQQQLSSMRASAANDHGSQLESQHCADQHGQVISDIQRSLNAPAASTWVPLRAFSVSLLSDLRP